MRNRLESLIRDMLDGGILLTEAVGEFEKVYIESAMARNGDHLCHTAAALGIHRNTLSKRVAEYNSTPKRKTTSKTPKSRGKKPSARSKSAANS